MLLDNPHEFRTPDFIKKYGPVLTKDDIPYPAELIFNAGVAKYNGKYVMLFRNDYDCARETIYEKSPKTNLGFAVSNNGIKWEVAATPRWAIQDDEICRVYDPRLTVIDGKCYVCFAMDTRHGLRGGIAVTEDFDKFEILSLTAPDNRNMVLFPEKINNMYMRLERPMSVYGRAAESFDLWSSASPDMEFWGRTKLVLTKEQVQYTNSKIGPGAPPIKTKAGWLCTYHAVKKMDVDLYSWHKWNKAYYGGLMLLALDDPTKIIAMADKPLLVPDQDYELDGFRGSVIFPGGMIREDSGEVKIYYGAADTVECLAVCDEAELLDFVKNKYTASR
jgi:beta-1,4-mannooligosaccharide/beta-1,4-mannosyl-N-acetylglucosamine phosphorylase